MAIDPIAIGDIVQVVIGVKVEGQQCLNVLYYRADSNQGPNTYVATIDNLLNRIESDEVDGIIPHLIPCMAPNAIHNFIQGQRVYPVRSIPIRTNLANDGTHVDDCDATNVSAVISKKVEKAGRGRTGSFHVAGVPNTGYALGSITEAYAALLEQVATRLDSPQAGITPGSFWNPGTFNPELGVGDNFVPIVDAEVKRTLRVMRRRTVGVGI